MAYATDAALAVDATFRGKVQMSMVKAAVAIASEARTVRNTVDQKRAVLARDILNNPTGFVDRFSYATIVAGALVTASTDAAIDTAVSSVWNGIAGITTEELS